MKILRSRLYEMMLQEQNAKNRIGTKDAGGNRRSFGTNPHL